jgi:hypothetical protein
MTSSGLVNYEVKSKWFVPQGHQFSGQQSSLEYEASALDAPSYSGPLLLLRFANLARSLLTRTGAQDPTLVCNT